MKLTTIKTLSALVFSVAAIGASKAHAANEVLSGWERIETIQPTVQGWVPITLKNGAKVSCGSTTAQTAADPFLSFSTTGGNNAPIVANGGLDRVYAAILSALTADKEIRFRLSPSTDGNYCYVERVYIR